MLNKNSFAVLILTHGRPDNVLTTDTLRKQGYTGEIFYVIDDEDQSGDEYRRKFGEDKVFSFSKNDIEQRFDPADTQSDRRSIFYARNASFDIARKIGLDYFVQLDDDYVRFAYRVVEDQKMLWIPMWQLDRVFRLMIDLLEDTGALTVALSQGGDHIGGIDGNLRKGILRKAMNSFFVRTNRPVEFIGRLNEDVSAYVLNGSRGELFLTPTQVQLVQKQTQQQGGGMTELYLHTGTYTKSFYSVMMMPSAVTVGVMQAVNTRMHHMISWDHAIPKIISGRYRKS